MANISFRKYDGPYYPIGNLLKYDGRELQHIELVFKQQTNVEGYTITPITKYILPLDRNVPGMEIEFFEIQRARGPGRQGCHVVYAIFPKDGKSYNNQLVVAQTAGFEIPIDGEEAYDYELTYRNNNNGFMTKSISVIGFTNLKLL